MQGTGSLEDTVAGVEAVCCRQDVLLADQSAATEELGGAQSIAHVHYLPFTTLILIQDVTMAMIKFFKMTFLARFQVFPP